MKNANGTATSMQSTVTSTAMSRVRPMMPAYVALKSVRKFSSVTVRTTRLVKGSVRQNAVAKMTARAPR